MAPPHNWMFLTRAAPVTSVSANNFNDDEVVGNGYLRFEPVRCTVSHQRQPSNGRAEGVGFNKSSSSDD